jgi:signal transduction histidine kinase
VEYAGEIRIDSKECEPRKLLAEALAMAKIPQSVKTINNVPNELSAQMDPEKITRVFFNIIKNAVDAMPNGGTLTIGYRRVDSSIEISFADTGVGISEEILPKIFSPLFTTKAQGMGFGLAICKRFAEAHGGTITVETVEGKGTMFKVTLPAGSEEEIEREKVWVNVSEPLSSTTPEA